MNRRQPAILATAAMVVLMTAGTGPRPWTQSIDAARADTVDSAAVAAVTQFMKDRDTHDANAAYALFAADAKTALPLNQMTKIDMAGGLGRIGAPSEIDREAMSFFVDYQEIWPYSFRLSGPDPSDPSPVLVTATPTGGQPATLRIFTVRETDGVTRLDLMKTMLTADPSLKTHAEATADISNLKQLALGVLLYAQDHAERFPASDRWMDEILPYTKSRALFHDPSDQSGHAASYAFNRALSGATLASVSAPATTVLIFDSTLGTWNASDTGQSLPHPDRHNGGNDFAYADGHVRKVADGASPSGN
jgi:prepilin-type processing-associated H-X9-DG protein